MGCRWWRRDGQKLKIMFSWVVSGRPGWVMSDPVSKRKKRKRKGGGREERRGAMEREKGGGRWRMEGEREKKMEKCVRAKGSRSEALTGGNASVAVCGQWQNKMGVYFTIPYVFFCIWKIFGIKSFKKLLSLWGRTWTSFVALIRQRWPSKTMKVCLHRVYYSFYGFAIVND